jgi:predicted nucleic acid-binding protein
MIVVADTSPLNYLILIDEIELLPALFGRVFLPAAVMQELQHSKSPLAVRDWIAAPPAWIEVRSVTSSMSPSLMKLDLGEREAIQLALDLGATTILMDEAEGRKLAESLHLQVRGTLGIIERAAKIGKVNARQILNKLESTTFRISPAVRDAFLRRNP